MMEVEFLCSACGKANRSTAEGPETTLDCASCGKRHSVFSQFTNPNGAVQYCGVCGCRDLYVQKDFSRKVGCTIAAAGAILAPFTKLISLFVCALIDLILYKLLPMITICYRCHSIYRDFAPNPEHEGFNLGINDRYRAAER